MIMLLSRTGHEAELIDDFKGLAKKSPWFAGVMAVFMFSLAGIPPTVGFYAKLAVLQSLVSTNVPGFIWLAVIAVVLSLLGAFYYLRVVKVMYFDDPVDAHPVAGTSDARFMLVAQRRGGAAARHPARRPDADVRPGDRADVRHLNAGRDRVARLHAIARPRRRYQPSARDHGSVGTGLEGPPSDVRRDRVSLPDGHVAEREYIVHPGAVMVVAMLDAERLIVERQWRHPIGKALIEFPAGKLEGRRAGARLRGARAVRGNRLPRCRMGPRRHHPQCDRLRDRGHRDLVCPPARPPASASSTHGEFLDVLEATADELEAAAGAGELTDAKTLIGLLWLRNWQAGRWPLSGSRRRPDAMRIMPA